MTAPPLPRRAALAACGLWAVGAVLAGATGVRSLTHSQGGYAAVYALVTAGLATLAVATYRAVRMAETVTLVLLGSQLLGTVGAAWELVRADEGGAKARHLDDLGINFRLAVAANLIYSATASAVFVWAWRERRRSRGAISRRS